MSLRRDTLLPFEEFQLQLRTQKLHEPILFFGKRNSIVCTNSARWVPTRDVRADLDDAATIMAIANKNLKKNGE